MIQLLHNPLGYFLFHMVKNTKEFNERVAHKVHMHIPIEVFVDYDPKYLILVTRCINISSVTILFHKVIWSME